MSVIYSGLLERSTLFSIDSIRIKLQSNMQWKPCQSRGKMSVRIGVKDLQLGGELKYALMITNEAVEVLDLIQQDVCAHIRRNSYPRSAKLSRCQKFAVVFFTDNTVSIYSTRDGSQINKIVGVPRSANSFVISGNSKKLLFANNSTLCLWGIPHGDLLMSSNQWRNINCYSIRDDGQQIALGTYSGSIIVLTFMGPNKVSELELKRHTNCVMQINYCRNGQLISISYQKLFIKAQILSLKTGERQITYQQLKLQSIPQSISEACGVVFFMESDGSIGWLEQGNKIVQYSNAMYRVAQDEGKLLFLRYRDGEIDWFQRSP